MTDKLKNRPFSNIKCVNDRKIFIFSVTLSQTIKTVRVKLLLFLKFRKLFRNTVFFYQNIKNKIIIFPCLNTQLCFSTSAPFQIYLLLASHVTIFFFQMVMQCFSRRCGSEKNFFKRYLSNN